MSRLTYIEIDLEVCENVYGVAPCSAELGVTGERKCFNTRKTCQVPLDYIADSEPQVLRLAVPTMYNPLDIQAIDNIENVSYTPSMIKLGESIGVRSTLKVTCSDHPSPDTGAGGDPYLISRDYNPYSLGTLFGKLKARQPYMRGNIMRWYNGRVGQTLEQMERRTFIIDSIEGPSTSGKFSFTAKDPLSLTDSQRAQAPRLSRGFLLNAINASATSITLTPAGIGNLEYPASGKVSIGGNEIVSFTRSGDAMTITRAQNNTEASEHDADDRVQVVLEYTGEAPDVIIKDLMVTYGNVPASFINDINWDAEVSEFLARLYGGVIAEPTPVVKLINEILEQCAISIWWDEVNETIRLQVLRDVTTGSLIYNDDVILGGSFQQKDQPGKRVSEVWTYFGQINPLESLEDPKNYRNTLVTTNLQSETNHGTPAIKTIYSRWINQFARPSAERLNNLILGRYAEPPKMFEFSLLRDSGVQFPALGGGLQLASFFNQDDTGAVMTSPAQAVQIKVSDSKYTVSAEEVVISSDIEPDDPTVKLVPIDNDSNNFNLRTAYLDLYPEAQDGDTVVCEVRSGVVLGSESIEIPSLRLGSGWPAGVSFLIKLLAESIVAGRGGVGGNASAAASNSSASRSAANGGAGGAALFLDGYSADVENYGTIGGGGGGGGGASWSFQGNPDLFSLPRAIAAGGGEGQGLVGGSGGTATATVTVGSLSSSQNGGSGGITSAGYGGSASVPLGFESVNASGGDAGGLGQSGSPGVVTGGVQPELGAVGSGGTAGPAIDGESLITWINEGTILGARIN